MLKRQTYGGRNSTYSALGYSTPGRQPGANPITESGQNQMKPCWWANPRLTPDLAEPAGAPRRSPQYRWNS